MLRIRQDVLQLRRKLLPRRSKVDVDWDVAVDHVLLVQQLWTGIQGRCNTQSNSSYCRYGAVGITLCQKWTGGKGKVKFMKWAFANGWSQGLQIDRKENSKGYSPDNCRFVTPSQNARNKTNNRLLTYKGETKCVADWGEDERCGVPFAQFRQRITAGWDIERALTQPLQIQRRRNAKRKKG